ncbi:unnamed protein product [Leptidea sinapis]|uniref:PHD-type domain-containing protein n=1 Tax=Leptidea sinapis TaxID=189913 RepID=A0A5E4QH56_9NEOP|nr:unnamed protein product [Leptidea sinapis]
MTKGCAGCSANLRKEYLVCRKCNDFYDLMCANLTLNKFNSMNKDSKNAWICHACRCKIPKGDNTNTPIRNIVSQPSNISPSSSGSDQSNITMRNKSRQGTSVINQISESSSQNTSHSHLDKHASLMNNLSKEEIRGIVRDELSIVFSHLEASLLKNMETKNNELIERVEQLTTSLNFFEEKYEKIRADTQKKMNC